MYILYVCVCVEMCTYAHMPVELRSGFWVANLSPPIHAAGLSSLPRGFKGFMCIYGHVARHSTGRGQRVTLGSWILPSTI